MKDMNSVSQSIKDGLELPKNNFYLLLMVPIQARSYLYAKYAAAYTLSQ